MSRKTPASAGIVSDTAKLVLIGIAIGFASGALAFTARLT